MSLREALRATPLNTAELPEHLRPSLVRSTRARFSTARRDLLTIVEVTRDEWGTEQAARYRRSLQATCDRLATYPRARPDLTGPR
jgi:hypothetical protein